MNGLAARHDVAGRDCRAFIAESTANVLVSRERDHIERSRDGHL